MTLSTQTSRLSFNGDGVSTTFSFPYYTVNATDIYVYLVSSLGVVTPQVLGTNYTLSGAAPFPTGLNVIMNVAPPTGSRLAIARIVPYTQQVDLVANDPIPAESIEQALDLAVMMTQQVVDQLGRSPQLSPASTQSNIVLADLVANAALIADPTGTSIIMGPSASQIATAQNSAVNAATYAANAAASAAAAATFNPANYLPITGGTIVGSLGVRNATVGSNAQFLINQNSGGDAFLNNQSSGALVFGTSNTERARFNGGSFGIGNNSPQAIVHAGASNGAPSSPNTTVLASQAGTVSITALDTTHAVEGFLRSDSNGVSVGGYTLSPVRILLGNGEVCRWGTGSGDTYKGGYSGSPPYHVTYKNVTGAGAAMETWIDGAGRNSVIIYGGSDTNSPNGSNTILSVRTATGTGRSINAAGTINASGADYAEYESKRQDCGTIDPGQIIGFDANGLLTDVWANAIGFGVKSTNPNLVGGDSWASGAGDPPPPPSQRQIEALTVAQPALQLVMLPAAPALEAFATPVRQYNESDDVFAVRQAAWQQESDLAADDYVAAMAEYDALCVQINAQNTQIQADYDAALATYSTALAAYETDKAAAATEHTAAMTQYAADVTAWQAVIESARQNVDRIAYCGKVPVNVTGAAVGDYIVPIQTADGKITGKHVAAADIVFADHRIAVGKVRRILGDGRAEIVVKAI